MYSKTKLILAYCLIQFLVPLSIADSLTADILRGEKPKTLESNRFYGGFGLSDHSSTIENFEGDAIGFSIFGGYILPVQPLDYAKFSLEAGYLSTENFDWESTNSADPAFTRSSADSVLASGIVEVNLIGRWQLIGRAGYDFGDDVGNFFGAGLGYLFPNGLGIRTEYKEQDKIDTIQLNITMRVKDILY